VAIKEYYPATLAGREAKGSTQLSVNAIKGERAVDEYAAGLRHFLYEARRQAKLASSPGIVSVMDFFEANSTAYYVMEYVDGSTLVKYIQKPLPFPEALSLLSPIADSLMSVHKAGLIHRDISPDNIMCTTDGELRLLDFGASHSFTGEESTTGNATLKHGFAPPEQYGSSSMQGPWTDVYAFAATLYWCVTGKIPQDSMDRSIGGDRLLPPSELGADISPDAEAVLMRGLALPIAARYQSMERFWSKLNKAERYRPEQPHPTGGATVFVPGDGEEVRVFRSHTQQMDAGEDMETPEPTIRPTGLKNVPVSAKAPRSTVEERPEPDLSRFKLSGMEEKPERPQSTEAAQTAVEEKPFWRRSRMTPVFVALIVVLAALSGYLAVSRPIPGISGQDSAQTLGEGVTIGGTLYALDTPELHLTSDPSYVSQSPSASSFTTLSYLTESDWAAVCSLTGLKKLSLVGFDLSSLDGLEALTNLEVLDVSHNDLTNLSPLDQLHLNELYATGNQLTSAPAYESLVYLDLSDNDLTELAPLATDHRLTNLALNNNCITDLSPLEQLTSLRTLGIAGNGLTDIGALYGLNNLKNVSLDGNTLGNNQLLTLLKRCPDCKLDVEVLTDIPKEVKIGSRSYPTSATSLDLESRNLTDEDIANLKYMVNLHSLKMAGNNVTDLSVISRLYGLTYLDVGHNQLTDLSLLSGLINLETLLVSSNQVTDLTPVEHLTHLVNLSAGNNPISDLSPLSELESLRMIAICDFRASSLEPLYPLTGLIELRITRGAYTDTELEALHEALPKCTVNQFKSS
jgi:serine/threonine protein kinase